MGIKWYTVYIYTRSLCLYTLHLICDIASTCTVYIQVCIICRNEQYQEELWRISCDLLKDWMSPEIWSKYSPSTETTATAAKQDSGNIDGEDDQPTTITDENKPVEDGDKPVEDGDKPVEDGDKPVEDGNKPVEDGNNPVEDGDKPPVEDGDKSVQDGDKSAEGY